MNQDILMVTGIEVHVALRPVARPFTRERDRSVDGPGEIFGNPGFETFLDMAAKGLSRVDLTSGDAQLHYATP